MIKRLQPIGDGYGVLIDGPILETLGLTPDTDLDVSTDGERLILTPVREDGARRRRFERAQQRTLASHERTFRELAK